MRVTDEFRRVGPRPRAWRSAGFVLAAALAGPVLAYAQQSQDDADALDTFPLAVVCAHGGAVDLYYLTRVRDDGRAIYTTLDGGRSGSVTADGRIEAQTEIAPGSCQGRTLRELRADGRTIEMR